MQSETSPPTLKSSLTPANLSCIKALRGWFDDEAQLRQWGGPGLSLDVDEQEFAAQIQLKERDSFTWLNASDELIGFAQIGVRLGRAHLGRIAISPQLRGTGLGRQMFSLLMQEADKRKGEWSLFVLKNNLAAIRLYQSFGFEVCDYPETLPADFDDMWFMLKH